MEKREDFDDGWSIVVTGAGGGGGGKSGPEESPDTLKSRAQSSTVSILSEGEILGFLPGDDPLTRIFLDDIPVKNALGDFNFQVDKITTFSAESEAGKGSPSTTGKGGVPLSRTAYTTNAPDQRSRQTQTIDSLVIDYRVGTQDQSVMPGFDDVRVEQAVGTRLTQAAGAVTRITTANDYDRIRLRVGAAALNKTDNEGNTKGTSVTFRIQIRPEGGSLIVNETQTIDGKSSGPVDFEYEYKLSGAGPWVITLSRETGDSNSVRVQDELIWRAIVGIYDQAYRYPNTALLGLKVGAENFTAVPRVSADLYGIKAKIPSNYNPFTREYSGIWNGTFKTDWTDNPAWIFYDLLTNGRHGCGQFIAESNVDRYSLYAIAQYCDEMVPDGKGGMEPRLTFNAYINDRGEAYDVLNALSAAFRGMTYFSEGSIVAIQDRPKAITKIYSPANVYQQTDDSGNVTEAPFVYEGTARKARKTVALVSWNDPRDKYKTKIEYVEDREGLLRYGYHEKEVRGFGVTSQGQAQRLGRWILLSDQFETETVTFKLGIEGNFVLPGEIIGIADPSKGGKRYGGRIESVTASGAVLDQEFTFSPSSSYQLAAMNASGVIESKSLGALSGPIKTVPLPSPFSETVVAGAPWVLQENSDSVRTFRVTAVNEDDGLLTILATLYDEQKFALTDNGTILERNTTPTVSTLGLPTVRQSSIVFGGGAIA
jgi:predicted phage tail protein